MPTFLFLYVKLFSFFFFFYLQANSCRGNRFFNWITYKDKDSFYGHVQTTSRRQQKK